MAESTGRVTIAQEVLNTIARLTTLSVPGVSHLGSRRALGRSGDGVEVVVNDNQVAVDVFVIVEPDHNLREIGQMIQSEIARSMQEIVGMEAVTVNVHIQDVEAPAAR